MRYVHSYGALTHQLLAGKASIDELGIDFGAGLYQHEVDYLIRNEWVMQADDLLWRRSKLGLFLGSEESARLADYISTVV